MSRFDQIISRTGTSSVRWDKYPEGVIPLWVADMDFSVPECVSEALSARIAHPIYGYTYASHTLREAIQEYLNKEYDYSIEKEWLVFIPSVVSGLHMVARNLLEDTHHALIPRPAYHHFQMAMEGVNRSYSYYTFDEVDNRWTLNYDYFKKSIQPNTRLIMLCNPHNPGGTVFNQEEIEWINILAKKNNLIVCSDEIHADLILDKGLRHFPIGKDISANQATVGLMSLNKSYNFPGIGLGWAVIANPTLRAKFSKGLHTLIPGPNLLAFEATLAAIKGGQIWHKELIDYLRKNRDLVEEWVQQYPSLKMVHLPATYLAWIDASALPELDIPKSFLAQGVAVSPGEQFGSKHFFRLNFGTSRPILEQALEKMSKAIKAYQ